MSNVGCKGRSFLPITRDDLVRLAAIARADRERFFAGHPQWAALYAERVLCVALCQGAALHYLDSSTGINDFDVYTFYRQHSHKRWCARRIKSYDFGRAKFGQSLDKPDFVGRRVDCLGRSIAADIGEDPVEAVQRYLRIGHSETVRLLAHKAVILLEPTCGQVVWPENDRAKAARSHAE